MRTTSFFCFVLCKTDSTEVISEGLRSFRVLLINLGGILRSEVLSAAGMRSGSAMTKIAKRHAIATARCLRKACARIRLIGGRAGLLVIDSPISILKKGISDGRHVLLVREAVVLQSAHCSVLPQPFLRPGFRASKCCSKAVFGPDCRCSCRISDS